MKIQIEGWVQLAYKGQLRFSAVHDTQTKETIFSKANRDTGYLFDTDFNQPTVVDYYDGQDEINKNIYKTSQKNYSLKQELAQEIVKHYFVKGHGPDWVKAAVLSQRQFNISEEDNEHEDFGKYSFFLYVDPMKE